jgi:hypothetical protein
VQAHNHPSQRLHACYGIRAGKTVGFSLLSTLTHLHDFVMMMNGECAASHVSRAASQDVNP